MSSVFDKPGATTPDTLIGKRIAKMDAPEKASGRPATSTTSTFPVNCTRRSCARRGCTRGSFASTPARRAHCPECTR